MRFSNSLPQGRTEGPWEYTTGWICGALRASKGYGTLFRFSSVIPRNLLGTALGGALPTGGLGRGSAANRLTLFLRGL